jgi:uncharacterized protein (TIGR03437 family)
MSRTILVLFCLTAYTASAQQTGPSLSIDANASRHPISPDIYGINFYWTLPDTTDPTYNAQAAAALAIRPTARRWGGNDGSTYHWQFQVSNLDSDWYFEVIPGNNNTFNQYADQARTTGGTMLGTIPALGWLPKANQFMCSYDVSKYGPQCGEDPYAQYHPLTCGNGIVLTPACATDPVYISNNDPTDAYAQYDQTFQQQWIANLLTRYGPGNQGGITIWSIDNEPIWWDSTHHDIHPNPYSYDELLNVDITYAAAIKQADPTALVSGPVNDTWASLWYSKEDIETGWDVPGGSWYSNPVDYAAHGNTYLLAWYLQQFAQYEKQHGQRLLDYVDLHAYIAPAAVQDNPVNGVTPPETDAVQALRLESTREFWDPTYVDTGDYWIVDPTTGAAIAPYYIPRVQAIIAQNYPGTKLAITEYNWYAFDTINGGLAQADLLGIFGAQGLDLATLWGQPTPADPVAFAYRMYRNYDGIGGAFGETSVQGASGDQSQLAIYAASRSDLNLTAMVINKTGNALTSTLSLANFQAGSKAQAWQYSAANLGAIVALPNITLSGNNLTSTYPANSITMLVIPPATLPVPKPVVNAVTNAASYATSIAPGQMVNVWGTNMGPTALAGLATDPTTGLVSTNVAGVSVLFDGIPAPIVYITATQIAVVTPYFGTANPTTHVQVEYQGVLSDPFPVAVAAAAPGLFTLNAQGTGPGAILNNTDYSVADQNHPAPRGSYIVIYGTGEGITDPPGVDGRLSTSSLLPTPVASVSVQIGGQPATVVYAGAAPGFMPGLFQIDAQVPESIQPGNSVPVVVTIGGVKSQSNVTVAVQ